MRQGGPLHKTGVITDCAWIITPGVTEYAKMLQILLQNEYVMKFI